MCSLRVEIERVGVEFYVVCFRTRKVRFEDHICIFFRFGKARVQVYIVFLPDSNADVEDYTGLFGMKT